MRDLVRCRETFQREILRSRRYLLKFLRRRGFVFREGARTGRPATSIGSAGSTPNEAVQRGPESCSASTSPAGVQAGPACSTRSADRGPRPREALPGPPSRGSAASGARHALRRRARHLDWRLAPVRAPAAAHGLSRPGGLRRFLGRSSPAGINHQAGNSHGRHVLVEAT